MKIAEKWLQERREQWKILVKEVADAILFKNVTNYKMVCTLFDFMNLLM